MKMKKLAALCLSGAMALSLVACGGSGGSGSGEDSDVIKIGLYTPLTGSSAMVGTQEQNGVNLAAKQINEAGGINGKTVEVIAYDDQLNAEEAVKAVTRLLDEDQVNAIVGSMSSGNILATADMVDDAEVLELGCGTSPSWTNAGYQYVFRGTQNSASFNEGIVTLMTTNGCTKLGTLTSSTEWATTGWADVKSQLEDTDIEVVIETDFMEGDTDFSGQITKLVNEDIDGILLYGGTEDFGVQCKQIRQAGYEGAIYGPETFASPDVRDVAGDAANGVFFACGYVIPDEIEDAANDQEKAFLEAYVEEYGEMPKSDTAYRGYDSMKLLEQVFLTADSMEGPDLREALLNVDYTGIAGTFDYSDESGDGLTACNLFAVVDGKNIPYDDYLASK